MNRTHSPNRIRAWLFRLALLIVVLAPSLARAEGALPSPPPARDLRFGAVASYDAPDVATAAGVGWTRVLFWWHQMQPRDRDDWNPHYFPDGVLNRELDDGRMMVGILAGTPPWASATGSVRAVPTGLYLPADDPGNLWGQFVYRMAHTYRGRIDHWIIWNEPDIWDATSPGKTWDGTVEDYVQLLRVAYTAAKAANSDAVIHLAATTYWWDAEFGRELYINRLLKAIAAHPQAAASGGFFDVASVHMYFKPDEVHYVTALHRQLLTQYGFGNKPIWINETNAPPSEDPQHPAPGLRFAVSLDEQSSYVVQAWAMGLAAGAERIALYKTRDEPDLLPGVEPYGLQRRDGSLRPVFWAYRTVVTYLANYQRATLAREGNIRRVVIDRGAQGTTTVVWNMGRREQEVKVPATAESALLVDPFGPIQPLPATGGAYTLVLPPARGINVGGRPFLLVEGAGAQVSLERPAAFPAVLPLPRPVTAPDNANDWALSNGRFFTQTAAGKGGFSVVDDSQARFWSAYQQLGGAETVGYPISQRFMRDGFVTQAFQKLILQWRPDVGQAWPVNVFDELSKSNFDQRLLETRQTPHPLVSSTFDPPGASWGTIVAGRHALLDTNAAIRSRYFAQPDALTVFGLPTSRVEDMGNHYALRTQRAVFQQWKEAVPWAAAGQVTIANGGAIAQELGWLPAVATHPEPIQN